MNDHNAFMEISLDEMMTRIKQQIKPEYDIVVAIARGGVLPGYLVSRYLDIPMETIHLNLRDNTHKQIHPVPLLLKPVDFEYAGKRILLTDDVANSGATLTKAASLLPGAVITSLVISGNGTISLFGPHDRCIKWPWSK